MKLKNKFFTLSFVTVLLLCSSITVAQQTQFYAHENAVLRDAFELYDKEKFSAAQNKFDEVVQNTLDADDEIRVTAEYYSIACALALFNKDAEYRLKLFIKEYPYSPKINEVHFLLGRYNYRKREWEKAIDWYDKVEPLALDKPLLAEYHFKRGYSYFNANKQKEAYASFHEIVDWESEYQSPAIYYHSHIAYENGNYQTALNGFNRIKESKNFGKIIPYYITQIYYRQRKYKELIDYGTKVIDQVSEKRAVEISRMVGEAYFKNKKYKEAVPFLERYHQKASSSRDDNYQLAFTYYKIGENAKAIDMFNGVINSDDKMTQLAYYHMGDAYVKIKEKRYARNAYQRASLYDFDTDVQEDAHFNYARLAYDTDYTPFSDALEAFLSFLDKYPKSLRTNDVYQYLMNVYMTTKNYEVALESIEKLNKKDYRLRTAYQVVAYNRGIELYNQKEYKKAVDVLKKVKRFPLDKKLNVKSLYWIAEAEFLAERYNAAIKAYDRFIIEPGAYSSPLRDMAYYNKGYAYYQKSFTADSLQKQSNYMGSIASFRKFVDSKRDNDQNLVNDALLRIGDANYAIKNDLAAVEFYQRAIQMNGPNRDYALFYRAKSLGYLGRSRYVDKVMMLKRILKEHQESYFVPKAKFELAETYRVMGDDEKAEKYYNVVLNDYEGSPKSKSALRELAGIYSRMKEYKKAKEIYLKILSNEPSREDVYFAVEGLRPIYTAQNDIATWDELAQKHGLDDYSASDRDSIFFHAAKKSYDAKDCGNTIKNFTDYLSRYTKSKNVLDAYFYRGQCYFVDEKYTEALKDYNYIINQPVNRHSEISLLNVAYINYKNKQFHKSAGYYAELEKIATDEQNNLTAQIGAMRSYEKLDQLDLAMQFAEKVKSNGLTKESIKWDAYMILGKGYHKKGELDKAYKNLTVVARLTDKIVSYEANYLMIDITHKKGNHKQAEKQVFKFFKDKQPTAFWRAKTLIVLSDVYVALSNNDQAKMTLNSIIDNYTGNDDIIEVSRNKLREILELEEEQNRKPELEDEEIEFDPEQQTNSVE